MEEQTNNKTIAKNTLVLYFRMIVMMAISFYTSRIVLDTLGVTDFAVNATVGSVTGFLGFLNGALSVGTSRFMMYGLGTGDGKKLNRIFSTAMIIHVALGLVTVLAIETVGLWFLYNKLVIPPERFNAALWLFHLSVVGIIFCMTQVPYGALITAHEKMSAFAYLTILDAVVRLLIVYALVLTTYDKLIFYAALNFIWGLVCMAIYRVYCIRHFKESRFRFCYDKSILKEIGSFSGWSLFAQISIALNGQGILLLLNMFFAPAVVAARSISLSVSERAMGFVNNFRYAMNPQIVKRYAAGDFEGSKKLLLASVKYSFYLTYVFSLPICLLAYPLLDLWLVEVPEYSDIFLQLVIIQNLFCVFDMGFYMALYAKGRLKENALISPTMGFIAFSIVYVLFRMGCGPLVMSWASLITYALLGFVIKPILIIKIVDYKWSDILPVYWNCLKVAVVSLPIPLLLDFILDKNTPVGFLLICAASVLSVSAAVWAVGFDAETRVKVVCFAVKKMPALGRFGILRRLLYAEKE